jgi:hypothetical protein
MFVPPSIYSFPAKFWGIMAEGRQKAKISFRRDLYGSIIT